MPSLPSYTMYHSTGVGYRVISIAACEANLDCGEQESAREHGENVHRVGLRQVWKPHQPTRLHALNLIMP